MTEARQFENHIPTFKISGLVSGDRVTELYLNATPQISSTPVDFRPEWSIENGKIVLRFTPEWISEEGIRPLRLL